MGVKILLLAPLALAVGSALAATFTVPEGGMTLTAGTTDQVSANAFKSRNEELKKSENLNLEELDERLSALDGKTTYDGSDIAVTADSTISATIARIKEYLGEKEDTSDGQTKSVIDIQNSQTKDLVWTIDSYIAQNSTVTSALSTANTAQSTADLAQSVATSAKSTADNAASLANAANMCSNLGGKWGTKTHTLGSSEFAWHWGWTADYTYNWTNTTSNSHRLKRNKNCHFCSTWAWTTIPYGVDDVVAKENASGLLPGMDLNSLPFSPQAWKGKITNKTFQYYYSGKTFKMRAFYTLESAPLCTSL